MRTLKRKAEFIISTDYGKEIIHHLEGYDITKVDMTAMWEMKLSDVATGKKSYDEYRSEMISNVKKETQNFINIGKVVV